MAGNLQQSNVRISNTFPTAILGPDPSFYDWLERSHVVAVDTMRRTSDLALVGSNPKFTPVNGALEVDIKEQVNAERIGTRQVSIPGGQPAYLRAARRSTGGTSIVALKSTVPDGPSKIVTAFSDSGVVTTPRVDADHVVTEHGTATLFREISARRTEQLIATTPHQTETVSETLRTDRNSCSWSFSHQTEWQNVYE